MTPMEVFELSQLKDSSKVCVSGPCSLSEHFLNMIKIFFFVSIGLIKT